MRCAGIARRTGRQCGQPALPGSSHCHYHQLLERAGGDGPREMDRAFYSGVLEEELGLEVATALHGVGDEIAVLRMLIRKVARQRVQYALEGRPADGLAGSIARVLDEMGNELGMAL